MVWPRSFRRRAASATGEGTGGGERGIFAQRMAGDHDGPLAERPAALFLQHAQHGERVGHQGGLGVLGQDEFFAGPLEHQARELLLQGLVDFLEHLAGGGKGAGEVASHADGLAALAREDEGVNRHCERIPSGRGATR